MVLTDLENMLNDLLDGIDEDMKGILRLSFFMGVLSIIDMMEQGMGEEQLKKLRDGVMREILSRLGQVLGTTDIFFFKNVEG